MIKFRNEKVKLPFKINKHLDPYLEEDEEVVDVIMETIVPRFDLRWIMLTNLRVIQITYSWFEYFFRDVRFDGIDTQITQGIFYDSLSMKSMTDDYRAHFYALARTRTKEFLQEIEDERERYGYQQRKNQVAEDHHIVEELILEGELPMEQDQGHREKLEKAKKQGSLPKKASTKSSKKSKLDNETALHTIGEIDDLKYQGVITNEEYEEKKQEILGRLRESS